SGALRAAHQMHLAHAAAVRAIRTEAPGARVGICHDVADLVPATGGHGDAEALVRHDAGMRAWFLGPTFGRGYPAEMVSWYDRHGFLDGVDAGAVTAAEPIDFLAVNYYRRERIAAAPVVAEWGIGSRVVDQVGEHAGNGWEIWPDGLRAVLTRIHDDYAPPEIAVTENGATFPDAVAADGSVDDEARRSYLERHVAAAADAIAGGVPLTAYFAWSLLDNFEWALGYGTRFGIVRVDYPTQRRTVKASGRWYRDLIAATQPRSLG
ncbi:MAG: glycoside hydrolase family 1 protein, partial [Vicinamibacterales bacterium]